MFNNVIVVSSISITMINKELKQGNSPFICSYYGMFV